VPGIVRLRRGSKGYAGSGGRRWNHEPAPEPEEGRLVAGARHELYPDGQRARLAEREVIAG
jgi:hypothetical protein